MTLSNFDWTDKTSVKWFILLPTGHEGPYSLESLMKKKTSHEIKIWAEGLSQGVTLKSAIEKSRQIEEPVNEEDEIPPLPPLPVEEDIETPPLPIDESETEVTEEVPEVESNTKKYAVVIAATVMLLGFGLKQWVSSQEKFSIDRASRMSPELFSRITQDFKFDGWNKKIFFKEYMASDMSHIWLVTSAFRSCKVEANFVSLKGKLLNQKDEKVSFKTSGELKNHMVEFSNFDFSSGNKIIPGLYEMDLRAYDCSWDGLAARLGNIFRSADESYITRMKVVLYHRGNIEFNDILDKLIRKKLDLEIKNQNQEELFWEDLQQKFQSLLMVTLQIEQLLLDFTDSVPKNYQDSLKVMVDKYTRDYGRFLTEFVVSNEKYFLELSGSDLSNLSQKRTYETMVRITSKNIGLESMKIIEELQAKKKISKKELDEMSEKIRKKFELQKQIIEKKIIQITEDRVN